MVRWGAIVGMAALAASPSLANDQQSNAAFPLDAPAIIVSRIEREYALPVDRDRLLAAAIELARDRVGDASEFDQCHARAKDNSAYAQSLANAIGAVSECSLADLTPAEKGLTARALSELLLGQLEGENLIFAVADLGEGAEPDDPNTVSEPEFSGEIAEGVLSFRLRTIPQRAAFKVKEQWIRDLTYRAIVFDLRANEGGTLPDVVELADLFLAEGDILNIEGPTRWSNERFVASSEQVVPDVPIAVLIDAETAQGGEMFAAALQDAGRAVVLGQQSSGRGTIRGVFGLNPDYVMTLVTSLAYRPSGELIEGMGVTPDCELDPARTDIADLAAQLAQDPTQCSEVQARPVSD